MDSRIIGAVIILALVVFIYQSDWIKKADFGHTFGFLTGKVSSSTFPVYGGYPQNQQGIVAGANSYSPSNQNVPTQYIPVSQYQGKVFVSNVIFNVIPGDILEDVSLSSNTYEPIDVAGWTLSTSRGVFYIPPASFPAQPGFYPYSQNVFVGAGTVLHIHSGTPQIYPPEFGAEGHVWIPVQFLDPIHDRIILRDSRGLTVSEYNY